MEHFCDDFSKDHTCRHVLKEHRVYSARERCVSTGSVVYLWSQNPRIESYRSVIDICGDCVHVLTVDTMLTLFTQLLVKFFLHSLLKIIHRVLTACPRDMSASCGVEPMSTGIMIARVSCECSL